MNSSATVLGSQLNLIQTYLTGYFMVPFYMFGNLGNLANIILFFERNPQLNNICGLCFIGLSLANLLIIDIGGLTRSLPFLTNFNLESTSLIFCKFRLYFVYFPLLLGRYFICLISIDRWMVTSSNESIRKMSFIENARYLIIVGTCICAIFSIHALIGFEIKFNRCYAYLNSSYSVFFSIYNALSVIIPMIIMTIFSMLIIVNIRQSRRRIHVIPKVATSTQQINMKFIRLALMQSLSFGLLNISFVVYVIYDFAISGQTKNSDQLVINDFLYDVSIYPIYIFSSITFATYTLASVKFRKECISTSRRLSTKLLPRFIH
ncbi:unnamed protein product [Adineta steineri]|uniref:G-protein coupled receptors family 1 profile domain-containing protein n=1 Tax=Adineta steineri TaxID=433720 RepID=A0A815MSR6_9BILA|nr:unnamed protein product [Adineta steineri]CAF1479821.1 unnamed protein product [Adineta steineri]CAF3902248.1 unnamed protein product [Adineta steineri]